MRLAEHVSLMAIGNRIALRRYELNMSQEDLALRVGRERSSIANLEAGRQNIPLTLALDVARELGTTLGYLVGEVSS